MRLSFVIGLLFFSTALGSLVPFELPEVPTYEANTGPVDAENDFTRGNPYFKQRAGATYEIDNLPFSAKALIKLVNIEPRKMVGTIQILRCYIYDWLDFQVRDNGKITKAHRIQALEAMNSRFKQLLSPIQYKIYEIWRDDESGEASNGLAFLMHSYEETKPQKAQQGAAANP